MKQKDIFNSKSSNSHSFSTFTSCVIFFDLQLATWDLKRYSCSFYMLKKIFYQKEETSKTDDVVDKPVSSFLLRRENMLVLLKWTYDTYDYYKSTNENTVVRPWNYNTNKDNMQENPESWLISANKLFWILEPFFSTNITSDSFFLYF